MNGKYFTTCFMDKKHDFAGKLYLTENNKHYIDFDKKVVIDDGKEQSITSKAFEILEHLIRNNGRIVTYEALIEIIDPYYNIKDYRTAVRKHITSIRGANDVLRSCICSKTGVGYSFNLPYDMKIRSFEDYDLEEQPNYDLEALFGVEEAPETVQPVPEVNKNENKLVFICHSSKDKEQAYNICLFLEKNGVPCWISSRDIDPGENYARQIMRSIKACSHFVFLASQNTNESEHVGNEICHAFDNKKSIVTFLTEDIELIDEQSYYVRKMQWIKAFEDYEKGLNQLLEYIQSHNGNKVEQPKAVVNNEPAPVKENKQSHSMTREEICDCVLRKYRKYPNSMIRKFESCESFEELTSCANSIVSKNFEVSRHAKEIDVEDIIDHLVNEIAGDSEAEVVKITGLPGTGKTLLLQHSFYKILCDFRQGKSNFLPFYVSFEYFEKAKYVKEGIREQVEHAIADELQEFLDYIEQNEDVEPVLFVDNVREHILGEIALENVLNEILIDKLIQKRVISVDTDVVRIKNKNKLVMPIFTERVSTSYHSNMIDLHDEKIALEYIEGIINYYDCNVPAKNVFETVKRLKFQEIDLFVIRAIAQEMEDSKRDIVNISEMYTKWALKELQGDYGELRSVAATAYQYLLDNDFALNNLNFNSSLWMLIHKTQSFANYLITKHLYDKICDMDVYNVEETELDFYKIMLTAPSDIFLGSFLFEDHASQEKIYNSIVNNFDSFTIVQKSSAVFWLAKLTFRDVIIKSVAFLMDEFKKFKLKAKLSDDSTHENYELQFYFRSVCYALIVFKKTEILDDYVCLLITNNSANAINRGSVCEYYSQEYHMIKNGVFNLDTEVSKGEIAIKAELWKISKKLDPTNPRFPELDLVTYCMLLQCRLQDLYGENVKMLRPWVEDAVKYIDQYNRLPQNTSSEKIKFYLQSVRDDFEEYLAANNDFDISKKLYSTLSRLNSTKRKQWTSKGINDPESITEHSYRAWMIAMLFLPSYLDYEDYSKSEIMDMLLIHDMAESILGDQLIDLREPNKDLKEQNVVMRKLMTKGTYSNIANLTYYYNIWTGYYNGININSRIARDINLIQTLISFCEYYQSSPEKFSKEDVCIWGQEKNKLQTPIGNAIYIKLIENNKEFANIFEQ